MKYYNKYIKYKSKYINLVDHNNQIGGNNDFIKLSYCFFAKSIDFVYVEILNKEKFNKAKPNMFIYDTDEEYLYKKINYSGIGYIAEYSSVKDKYRVINDKKIFISNDQQELKNKKL